MAKAVLVMDMPECLRIASWPMMIQVKCAENIHSRTVLHRHIKLVGMPAWIRF